MIHPAVPIPEPGQLIDVRQRRYVVADIAQSHLPPDPLRASLDAPSHLVTLTSVEDDALGEELQVIWEIKPGAQLIEKPEIAGEQFNPFDERYTTGVPVAAFPRWMLCPRCRTLDSGLFQLKADLYRTDRTRYLHMNCPSAGAPPPVIPARFLVACKYGHLDDFP